MLLAAPRPFSAELTDDAEGAPAAAPALSRIAEGPRRTQRSSARAQKQPSESQPADCCSRRGGGTLATADADLPSLSYRHPVGDSVGPAKRGGQPPRKARISQVIAFGRRRPWSWRMGWRPTARQRRWRPISAWFPRGGDRRLWTTARSSWRLAGGPVTVSGKRGRRGRVVALRSSRWSNGSSPPGRAADDDRHGGGGDGSGRAPIESENDGRDHRDALWSTGVGSRTYCV